MKNFLKVAPFLLIVVTLSLTGCSAAYEQASASVTTEKAVEEDTLAANELRFDEYTIDAKCAEGEPCKATYGDITADCTEVIDAEGIPANGVTVVFEDKENTKVVSVDCIWRGDAEWNNL